MPVRKLTRRPSSRLLPAHIDPENQSDSSELEEQVKELAAINEVNPNEINSFTERPKPGLTIFAILMFLIGLLVAGSAAFSEFKPSLLKPVSTPTPTLAPVPTSTPEPTPVTLSPDVRILVENATEINGLAGKVKDFLTTSKLNNVSTGNSSQSSSKTVSIILYSENTAEAEALQSLLRKYPLETTLEQGITGKVDLVLTLFNDK